MNYWRGVGCGSGTFDLAACPIGGAGPIREQSSVSPGNEFLRDLPLESNAVERMTQVLALER